MRRAISSNAARACNAPPKFVFASSLAVFGGRLPDPVPDDAPVTPQSSYGTQKAIGELLVNDMSRKGFIDGRSLRLPTIVVRPGKPNRAASSFASGIIREPLSGVEAICPVAPTTRMWVQSPRAVVDNLLVGHDASAGELPAFRADQRARGCALRSATWCRRCAASRARRSPHACNGNTTRRSIASSRRGRRASLRRQDARSACGPTMTSKASCEPTSHTILAGSIV